MANNLESVAQKAWYCSKPSFVPRLLSFLLLPVSYIYGLLMKARRKGFKKGSIQSSKIEATVISVGNLTLGGSSKTPTTIFLAKMLLFLGAKPAIISRGYKGFMEGETALVSKDGKLLLTPSQAGDEPVMMAKKLPDAPVIIGAERVNAARFALENLDINAIVLDDGFQHLHLQRDLNILCINGEFGFGNERVFPSGPLREPLRAVQDADLCIINNALGSTEKIERVLRKAGFSGEIVKLEYSITKFIPLDEKSSKTDSIKGAKCLAFTSIAQPKSFFNSLRAAGVDVKFERLFPDHHSYSPDDLKALDVLAKEHSIEYYVTTEKDGVKLIEMGQKLNLSVYLAVLEPQAEEGVIQIISNAIKGVL